MNNTDSTLDNNQDGNYTTQEDITVFLEDTSQPFLTVSDTEQLSSSTLNQSDIQNVFLLPDTNTVDIPQKHLTYVEGNDLSQAIILRSASSHTAITDAVTSSQIADLSQSIMLGSTSHIANTDHVTSTGIVNAVDIDNQQMILTENDLETLASCLFPEEDGNGMAQTYANVVGLDECLYTHPQESIVSNVGLSVNCITSSSPKNKSTKVDESKQPNKKKGRAKTYSSTKQELSKVFDGMDSETLPKDILLPLPTFCNCQVKEGMNAEQCLKKYNKVIFLGHVGRVILNGVELVSFKRGNTVFVSREQMECERMFAKKKSYVQQFMEFCGGRFLSMVDNLTQDEVDYLKQENIVSKRSQRKVAFSIGLACWILDFLNDQKTTPYAKILGHVCENPRNILMISKSQIRSKKREEEDNSPLALTTILIEDFENETDNKFLVVELGRVLVNVTCLAAFQVHQVNKCYVNCHQVSALLNVISAREFDDIVKKRNCSLAPMPEKISDHFMALDSSLPDGFFNSQWIEINEVSRICCFWMGRHGDDVANSSLLSDLAHNKIVYIFKKQAKGLKYPVTYPESMLWKNGTDKIHQGLSESSVSASAFNSGTVQKDDLLTLAAREILEEVCNNNFLVSESGAKGSEKSNTQTQNGELWENLNQAVSGENQTSPNPGSPARKRNINQVNYACNNTVSPIVKKLKIGENLDEHALIDNISNSQHNEIPPEGTSEAEKILQNILPMLGSTSRVEASKHISVDSTIVQTNSVDLLPVTKCSELQNTSSKTLCTTGDNSVVPLEGIEVFECVPLFPLENLMRKNINVPPYINPESPLKLQIANNLESPISKLIRTAEKACPPKGNIVCTELSNCEVKPSESDNNNVSCGSCNANIRSFHENTEDTTETLACDTHLVQTNPSKYASKSVNSKEYSVPNIETLIHKPLSFDGSSNTISSCNPLTVITTEADELKCSTSSELTLAENGHKTPSLPEKTVSAILQAQSLLKELIFTRSNIQTVTGRCKFNVMLQGKVRELFLNSGSENTRKMKHQLLKLLFRLVVNIEHVNRLQMECTSMETTPDDSSMQQSMCEGNFKNTHQSLLSENNLPKQIDTRPTMSPSYKTKHKPNQHSYTSLKVPNLEVLNCTMKDILSSDRQSEPRITSVSETQDFQKNLLCSKLNPDSVPNSSMHSLQSLDSANLRSSLRELPAEHFNQNTQEKSSQQALMNLPTKLPPKPSITENLTPAPNQTNIPPENCLAASNATPTMPIESSDLTATAIICEQSNSRAQTPVNKWPDSTEFLFSTEQSGITAYYTASVLKPPVSPDSEYSNELLESSDIASTIRKSVSIDSTSTDESLVSTDSTSISQALASADSAVNSQSLDSAVTSKSLIPKDSAVTSKPLVPTDSDIASTSRSLLPTDTDIASTSKSLVPADTVLTNKSPVPISSVVTSKSPVSKISPYTDKSLVSTDIASAGKSLVSTDVAFTSKSPVSTDTASAGKTPVSTDIALTNKSSVSTDIASGKSPHRGFPVPTSKSPKAPSSVCHILPHQAYQSNQNSGILKQCLSAPSNIELRSSNNCTKAMLCQITSEQSNMEVTVLEQGNSVTSTGKSTSSNSSIAALLNSPRLSAKSVLYSGSSEVGSSTPANMVLTSSKNSIASVVLPSNQSSLHSAALPEGSPTTPYMATTIPDHVDDTPVDTDSVQSNQVTGNKRIHEESRKTGDDVSDLVKKYSCVSKILCQPPKNNTTPENKPADTNALSKSLGNHVIEKSTPKKPKTFSPSQSPSRKMLCKEKSCEKGSLPGKKKATGSRKVPAKAPSVEYIYVSPKSVLKDCTPTTASNTTTVTTSSTDQDSVQKKTYKKKLTVSKLLEHKEKSEKHAMRTNVKYVAYAETRPV